MRAARELLTLAAMSTSSDPVNHAPRADSAEVMVDVCVCTYQRTQSLQRLLESLATQRDAPSFRVLIADNHATPVEAERVAQWAQLLPLSIRYLHAPAHNISIARNACLDHAGAEFIAFIDDDEIASANWLAQLTQAIADVDVVFGPVQAVYATDMPAWMQRGEFHAKVPAHRAGGDCDTGHTANVLLRRRCIGTLRFDPALGNSGGEDTLFFAKLKQRGARLRYCASAAVQEPIERNRARFAWLCQRARASGQAHARVLRLRHRRIALQAPLAALKVVYSAIAILLTSWSAVRWRRNALRACLHAGVFTSLLGGRDLQLYGDQARVDNFSQSLH